MPDDLQGGVITTDALHLLVETMDQVVMDKNGHMLVGLKGNREKLLEEVKTAFETTLVDKSRTDINICVGHGRIENRKVEIIPFKTNLKYSHINVAIKVRRERTQKKSGAKSREISYYVGTFNVEMFSPSEVQALIRGHWVIENRLHHVKDRTMMEDRCQAKSNVGSNMGLLRSVVTLLKQREKYRNKRISGMLKGNVSLTVRIATKPLAKVS